MKLHDAKKQLAKLKKNTIKKRFSKQYFLSQMPFLRRIKFCPKIKISRKKRWSQHWKMNKPQKNDEWKKVCHYHCPFRPSRLRKKPRQTKKKVIHFRNTNFLKIQNYFRFIFAVFREQFFFERYSIVFSRFIIVFTIDRVFFSVVFQFAQSAFLTSDSAQKTIHIFKIFAIMTTKRGEDNRFEFVNECFDIKETMNYEKKKLSKNIKKKARLFVFEKKKHSDFKQQFIKYFSRINKIKFVVSSWSFFFKSFFFDQFRNRGRENPKWDRKKNQNEQKTTAKKDLENNHNKKKWKKRTKKNAVNRIIDLIKNMIFMMTEHAPAILQKAWNDMIKKFNKIFLNSNEFFFRKKKCWRIFSKKDLLTE